MPCGLTVFRRIISSTSDRKIVNILSRVSIRQIKGHNRVYSSKMVTRIDVTGFDEYKKKAVENQGKNVFALFTGSVDSNGVSWCPDCSKADPVVNRNISKLPDDAVFIHCTVGDRTFWKDQKNIFRTDEELKLTCIPTLIKVGGKQRLQEEHCAKEELVEMLFTED